MDSLFKNIRWTLSAGPETTPVVFNLFLYYYYYYYYYCYYLYYYFMWLLVLGQGSSRRIITEFLVQMQGVGQNNKGVCIVAHVV